jgi:metal-responsive CopG/Arc/MetJ family transcriptional regulator
MKHHKRFSNRAEVIRHMIDAYILDKEEAVKNAEMSDLKEMF